VLINWDDAKDIIARRITAATAALEKAEDLREIGKNQGRIEVLREFLNLPNVLALHAQSKKEAETDGKR
jgi:hypothetical protein